MIEYIRLEEACKGSITVHTKEYGSIEVVPVDYLESISMTLQEVICKMACGADIETLIEQDGIDCEERG